MLLFITVGLLANDTLARAQVYNFNVGDTFDYKEVYQYGSTLAPPGTPWHTTITYSRYIIASLFYSPDSATKYIQRKQVYPEPAVFDTLVLTNLTAIEVYKDSLNCQYIRFTFDSSSVYHNRISNELYMSFPCGGGPYIPGDYIFAEGLGKVLKIEGGGAQDIEWGDSLILIYYAKGSETWGTPYYNLLSAVSAPGSNNYRIALFPTLNDGTFNLKINDTNLLPANLVVYDVSGREMKQIPLTNSSNEISVQSCSSGIYIWKVIYQGETLRTGRMVVK